jgi:hypothetical protein
MKHFFRKLDEIDAIIQSGSSRESATSLVALMSDNASMAYVLNKIDASWLEPLESIGFFRDLSSGDGSNKEQPRPYWYASAFLKRIASEGSTNPAIAKVLQRILSFIPSPGTYYAFRDIVDTATLLPREMRRGVVPFIQRAIGNTVSIEFSNITTLISRLAEEGETAPAIRLFLSVFAVFLVHRNPPKNRKYTLDPEPRSFMDAWHYKQELEKCLPTLTKAAGTRFLSCLTHLLSDYLRLASSRPAFQGPDDLSYIWRPAIEVHEQNARDDVRDSLVTAIRDCAESIASEKPECFDAVAEILDGQQWFIFTRVLLHLLSSSPTAPLSLIVEYSTQPYLFSEVTVRHEYSLLLKNRFRALTDEQQGVVLKMIQNGPDRLSYINAMTQTRNEGPSEKEVEDYVKGWKLDWLTFIADDLPAEWKARYDLLRKELPAPSHPEFPYYMTSGFGLGRRIWGAGAPPDGDAEGKTVEALLDQFAHAKLGGSEPSGKDLDDLLQELQTAAEANPQSAAERIGEIAALPAHYSAAVAKALANRASNAESDLASPALQLGAKAAATLRGTSDPAERESLRNSLTGILDQFLRDDNDPLSVDHIQLLIEMAADLLSTVVVSSGSRQHAGSEDFDPLFWAINSSDGRIVENAIKLALQDRKLNGDTHRAEPAWLTRPLSTILSTMPPDELQITAILGYRFPWLMYLSKTWATENADRIFPRSSESRWRWEAAWCAYVAFSGAYNDVFEALKDQYEKAVDEVSTKHMFKKSRFDLDQGLAQHLAVYYWRQLITLQHPMLVKFLTLGGKEPTSSFISHIGRGMSDVKDIPQNVTDSLRALAEWMTSSWKPRRKDANRALAAFGWWFPHEFLGDANWRLRMLRGAIRKAGDAQNIDRVLKELDKLAPEAPTLVVACLKGLVDRSPKETTAYFLASHSATILERAVEVADATTKAKIGQIADHFGSLGHFEYRRFAQP